MIKTRSQSKKTNALPLFFLGGALGVLVFLIVYGVSPLDVMNDAFCRGGYLEKDIQQHYAGWLFYRQSPLAFPLCIATGINAPGGLSVAYTDSIPLFAAFFRLLSPVLPATFQYFGWFTLLCFFLQGSYGALLLRLFLKKEGAALAGALLFVTSPVLFERALRHTSLGAQFFILAALYYYFSCRRADRFRCWPLFVLNILAITIHPYLVPMVYAITLAMLAEYALRHRRFWRPFGWLMADLAATCAVGWAFGLFYGTATGGADALYGYFSMNLNALWNPVGVGGTLWSRFLPAQNQVGGNYDAFAYLGLGVLAMLACLAVFVLVRRRHAALCCLRRHWALALVCLVLTAFAVSNVVTANGATLFTLPLPGAVIRLCSVFRSGGRMFWPVYYLLFLAAAAMAAKAGRAARVGPLAGVALLAAVQLWDISGGLAARGAQLKAAQQTPAYPTAMTGSFWQQAAGKYTHIFSMDGIQADALHLALYAADHRMTTNDPFAARYDAQALDRERAAAGAELAAGVLQQDTLYLFCTEGDFLQAVEPVRTAAWCGKVESGGCTWYVIAPGLQGAAMDAQCTPYSADYPLRMADYTDALWNRGVLDSTKKTICFQDSPFARAKLENAAALGANGQWYPIAALDDSDKGWLMVTLEIEDATVLWDQNLEIRTK